MESDSGFTNYTHGVNILLFSVLFYSVSSATIFISVTYLTAPVLVLSCHMLFKCLLTFQTRPVQNTVQYVAIIILSALICYSGGFRSIMFVLSYNRRKYSIWQYKQKCANILNT